MRAASSRFGESAAAAGATPFSGVGAGAGAIGGCMANIALGSKTLSLFINPKRITTGCVYSNRAACYTKLAALPEGLKDAEKCIEFCLLVKIKGNSISDLHLVAGVNYTVPWLRLNFCLDTTIDVL